MTDFLDAIVLFTNFVLLPGLTYGSQLALGALGVTIIYGILRFANFAHGDLMAFGTMAVILVTWWFQSLGLSIAPLPTEKTIGARTTVQNVGSSIPRERISKR